MLFFSAFGQVVARNLLFQFLIHLLSNGFLLRSVLVGKGLRTVLNYNYFLSCGYWSADGQRPSNGSFLPLILTLLHR